MTLKQGYWRAVLGLSIAIVTLLFSNLGPNARHVRVIWAMAAIAAICGLGSLAQAAIDRRTAEKQKMADQDSIR